VGAAVVVVLDVGVDEAVVVVDDDVDDDVGVGVGVGESVVPLVVRSTGEVIGIECSLRRHIHKLAASRDILELFVLRNLPINDRTRPLNNRWNIPRNFRVYTNFHRDRQFQNLKNIP